MIDWTLYHTPAGDLTVVVDRAQEPEAVIAAGFCPPEPLFERLNERLGSAGPGQPGPPVEPESLGATHHATAAYLGGDIHALEQVVVSQQGTDLQQAIWQSLREIPAGETRSYRELAESAGRPRASRAAGTACGRNLIAPFVPCHRAKRQDDSLGGYYYGLDVKRWLLDHEKSTR